MGDYVDEHGVGRNLTAGELMRMGTQRTKPTDLQADDLVDVPWIFCVPFDSADGANPNLRGSVERLSGDRVCVYVFPFSDDFEGGEIELPVTEVSLVERLDENGCVVWCDD